MTGADGETVPRGKEKEMKAARKTRRGRTFARRTGLWILLILPLMLAAVIPAAEAAAEKNTRLPLITDYVTAEMKDWKKETRDQTDCYVLTFNSPVKETEIVAYLTAMMEQLPLRMVSAGRADESREPVSVIRTAYTFVYEGETAIGAADVRTLGSYVWSMGDKNTPANLKIVIVQEADDPINLIMIYAGAGLSYDESEEGRLSAEALAARPTPIPTATPVPETEHSSVRLPWVTDYISTPLNNWVDNGVYSSSGKNLLLRFAECFDEREIDGYIAALSNNKNFTLIAHAVSDRSEEAGIVTDTYDFKYNGPKTILTIDCTVDPIPEDGWVLGGWNHETNLVVYVIRNSRAPAWNISLYLSPDISYDAGEAERALNPGKPQ